MISAALLCRVVSTSQAYPERLRRIHKTYQIALLVVVYVLHFSGRREQMYERSLTPQFTLIAPTTSVPTSTHAAVAWCRSLECCKPAQPEMTPTPVLPSAATHERLQTALPTSTDRQMHFREAHPPARPRSDYTAVSSRSWCVSRRVHLQACWKTRGRVCACRRPQSIFYVCPGAYHSPICVSSITSSKGVT